MSGTVSPHTLPLATTPAFTPAGTRLPTSSDGWQRAFERAIVGSVHDSGRRLAADPTPPAARPGVGMGEQPLAVVTRSVADLGFVANRALPSLALDPWEPVGSGSPSSDPLAQSLRETDDDFATSLPARRTTRKTSSPSDPQLHVHVEQHAEGLAVFLGLPGERAMVAAQAAALLLELRRHLQGVPQRLALVVCNGASIHFNPPLPKEKP